ncbi:MAG: hypothetical protein R3E83_22375 [Burkholderiaceae bacterium]
MLAAIVPSPVARYRAARLASAIEEWLADDLTWDEEIDLERELGDVCAGLDGDRFDS